MNYKAFYLQIQRQSPKKTFGHLIHTKINSMPDNMPGIICRCHLYLSLIISRNIYACGFWWQMHIEDKCVHVYIIMDIIFFYYYLYRY